MALGGCHPPTVKTKKNKKGYMWLASTDQNLCTIKNSAVKYGAAYDTEKYVACLPMVAT